LGGAGDIRCLLEAWSLVPWALGVRVCDACSQGATATVGFRIRRGSPWNAANGTRDLAPLTLTHA